MGKSSIIRVAGLWLCAAVITSGSRPAQAVDIGPSGDLTVTVREQSGGNVNFTHSGSAQTEGEGGISSTPTDGGNPPHAGNVGGGLTSPLPPGLTLFLAENLGEVGGIYFSSAGHWYLELDEAISSSGPGFSVSGSGSVTTNTIPFSQFVPGSFGVNGSIFDFFYVVIPLSGGPVMPPPPGGGPSQGPPSDAPILLVNQGAIQSANSGLAFSGANQSIIQNLGQIATGDLNNRLFNARNNAGGGGSGGGVASNQGDGAQGQGSLTRFLNFAAGQNIDYRVALGLAEGREVEYVDTLASSETVWMGNPFAMVGGPMSFGAVPVVTKAVVAVPGGGGKEVLESKGVVVPD